ncbi:MAG: hypothetical protein ACOYK9_00835 [Chlamydiia bacterium]
MAAPSRAVLNQIAINIDNVRSAHADPNRADPYKSVPIILSIPISPEIRTSDTSKIKRTLLPNYTIEERKCRNDNELKSFFESIIQKRNLSSLEVNYDKVELYCRAYKQGDGLRIIFSLFNPSEDAEIIEGSHIPREVREGNEMPFLTRIDG